MHWIRYAVWLLGQVIVAAAAVARDTIRITNTQHPIVVNYPLRVTSSWERTLFSTSITMTPGTLSVSFFPAESIADAHSESGFILLVHAVYGSDPAEIIAGLADMEEKLAPRVAATPIVYEEWMYAGDASQGYRKDTPSTPEEWDEDKEQRREQQEQEALAAAKDARRKLREQQREDHEEAEDAIVNLNKDPATEEGE